MSLHLDFSHAHPSASRACFGAVQADFSGYGITLVSTDDDYSEQHVSFSYGSVPDLVEAIDRHDGLLLAVLEYVENPDESITLCWTDYDMYDEVIGGEVTIASEHVPAFREWLTNLEMPCSRPEDAARDAAYEEHRRSIRERLYAGHPDTIEHEHVLYLLWAHDQHGTALYGRPHAPADDPARWLSVGTDGQRALNYRGQAPDRQGRMRCSLHPRPPTDNGWLWVRNLKPYRARHLRRKR